MVTNLSARRSETERNEIISKRNQSGKWSKRNKRKTSLSILCNGTHKTFIAWKCKLKYCVQFYTYHIEKD